jgi:hypothetical protein
VEVTVASGFEWRRNIGWAAGIAVATAMLHASILRLQWMYDDAFHLHFLLTHDLRFLVVPELWRELPFRMYTPLQFVSYAIDLHTFGVTPRAWYAHQLISLAVAASTLFLLLRLWWRPLTAAAGALLLAVNPHVVGWAGLLMARHYIEGFAFACLAIAAYVLFLRHGRPSLLGLALAMYAAAILSKEVFVLLPALMVTLPERKVGQRLRPCAWFAVVMVAYVVVRYVMLGTVGGGYGWAVPPAMRFSFFAIAPWRVVESAFSPAMLWIPVITGTVLIALRRPAVLLPVVAAVVAVVLPVIPVSTELEARYVVLPALIGSLVAFTSTLLFEGRSRVIAMTLLGIWIIAAAVVGNRPLVESQRRQSAESRFFQQLGPHDVLAHPVIPPAAIAELAWLKTYLHRQNGTGWFFDDIYACAHDLTTVDVWKHVGSRFLVVPPPARRDLPCNGDGHALSVDMQHEGDAVFWNLGPYTNGTFAIVLGDGVQFFSIPRTWGFHLGDLRSLTFRIRYASPSGWISYSPVLTFDFARQHFAWQRAAAKTAMRGWSRDSFRCLKLERATGIEPATLSLGSSDSTN